MKKLKRILAVAIVVCMLVSLSAPVFAANGNETSDTATVLKLGDYIQMGTYGNQPITWRVMAFEKVTGNNEDGTPVIDSTDTVTEYTEGYMPLLVTNNIITIKAFDAGCDMEEAMPPETSSHLRFAYGDPVRYSGSNYWGDSNIRCWLNSSAEGGNVDWTCGFAPDQTYMYPNANGYADEEGFLNSFAPTELSAIVSVSQKTLIDAPHDGTVDETSYNTVPMPETVALANENYDLYRYEYNTDTIFLPDIMQVYNIAQNANNLGGNLYLTSPTYYAQQQIPEDSQYYPQEQIPEDGLYSAAEAYPYWLRTPLDGSGRDMGIILQADAADISTITVNESDIGVRPACYIDMTALNMTSSDGTEYSPYTVDLSEYTVTYNASENGGTIQGESTVAENVLEGTDIMPGNNNAGVKDGYDFIGWNTDPNAKEGLTSYKVTGDVTLYAIYSKDTDIVAYFHNLDRTTVKSETVKIYNNDTTGTLTFPDEDDTDVWTFEGWTSDNESSEVEYRANDTADISEDTDYYAVYSRVITMTYSIDSTTSEGSQTQTYIQHMNCDSSFSVKVTVPAAPEREGYYFTGWRSQDNNQKLVPANGTVEAYEDTTFVAEWSDTPLAEYTVTYDYKTNGGDSASTAESKVKYNSLADLTPTAKRSGYEFVGWNTDSAAREALSEYAVTQDTTLYAIFKKTVSLRFYSRNGMIQTTIPVDLYNNETEGVFAPLPEVASYKDWTPLGWRNDSTAAALCPHRPRQVL